jgi:hypothetical protein
VRALSATVRQCGIAEEALGALLALGSGALVPHSGEMRHLCARTHERPLGVPSKASRCSLAVGPGHALRCLLSSVRALDAVSARNLRVHTDSARWHAPAVAGAHVVDDRRDRRLILAAANGRPAGTPEGMNSLSIDGQVLTPRRTALHSTLHAFPTANALTPGLDNARNTKLQNECIADGGSLTELDPVDAPVVAGFTSRRYSGMTKVGSTTDDERIWPEGEEE